jgi:hypothetical protein
MPFVKLDTGILDSSLWPQRPERELFITALLMAVPRKFDQPQPQLELNSLEETGFVVPVGEYGFIGASWVGVVERCHLEPTEDTREAMEALGNADPYSRSEEFEGRRLVRVNGGLIVLNYIKFRDMDRTVAARMKRYRKRLKNKREAEALRNVDVTRRNALQKSPNVTGSPLVPPPHSPPLLIPPSAEADVWFPSFHPESENGSSLIDSKQSSQAAHLENSVDLKPKKKGPLMNAAAMEEFKANPAYAKIDIDQEAWKFKTWCEANFKPQSKKRFVNWLNRV